MCLSRSGSPGHKHKAALIRALSTASRKYVFVYLLVEGAGPLRVVESMLLSARGDLFPPEGITCRDAVDLRPRIPAGIPWPFCAPHRIHHRESALLSEFSPFTRSWEHTTYRSTSTKTRRASSSSLFLCGSRCSLGHVTLLPRTRASHAQGSALQPGNRVEGGASPTVGLAQAIAPKSMEARGVSAQPRGDRVRRMHNRWCHHVMCGFSHWLRCSADRQPAKTIEERLAPKGPGREQPRGCVSLRCLWWRSAFAEIPR
jgi:hypothetical protein